MTLSARQLPSWRFARGILLSLSRHISLSYPVSFPPSLPSSPAAHLWPFICPLSLSPPLFWVGLLLSGLVYSSALSIVICLPPAVCPPGAGMVVQQFLVVWCKSPRCWYCDVYMDLTLVRLVQLFCPACPLSRLAWVGPAASVVGRGVRCQGCKAWHQRLRPCVGSPSTPCGVPWFLLLLTRQRWSCISCILTPPPSTLVRTAAESSSPTFVSSSFSLALQAAKVRTWLG